MSWLLCMEIGFDEASLVQEHSNICPMLWLMLLCIAFDYGMFSCFLLSLSTQHLLSSSLSLSLFVFFILDTSTYTSLLLLFACDKGNKTDSLFLDHTSLTLPCVINLLCICLRCREIMSEYVYKSPPRTRSTLTLWEDKTTPNVDTAAVVKGTFPSVT